MVDQEQLQKAIRAYVSLSVMMNSKALSPKMKEYLRDVTKSLETQLSSLRNEGATKLPAA